jgi:hypothetical protein
LNPHWDDFIATVPWFLDHGTMAKVGPSKDPGNWEPASPAFTTRFPALGQLLKNAFVASIDLNASSYVLFTWQRKDKSFCSWLSPAPSNDPPNSLYPDHQTLLASFGGIVERSNEPTWWALNHNDVLTEREARFDATFIADYAWAFERASVEVPIELKQFYSIAREANGNTTLCHRTTGEVLLFATDHAFKHVEVLPGCPEYTLYRFLRVRQFRDWVETIARQWRDWVA